MGPHLQQDSTSTSTSNKGFKAMAITCNMAALTTQALRAHRLLCVRLVGPAQPTPWAWAWVVSRPVDSPITLLLQAQAQALALAGILGEGCMRKQIQQETNLVLILPQQGHA